MRASHSAEGRLEARVVGVLILVQPLAEDGVHDALALPVDQPAHLVRVRVRVRVRVS